MADCIEVWRWNPRLYRRVLVSGLALGSLISAALLGLSACVWWLAVHV